MSKKQVCRSVETNVNSQVVILRLQNHSISLNFGKAGLDRRGACRNRRPRRAPSRVIDGQTGQRGRDSHHSACHVRLSLSARTKPLVTVLGDGSVAMKRIREGAFPASEVERWGLAAG